MPVRDPRVDAYIAKSADFAKPVLTYLRDVVHTTCPQVEETMKWNFPHFMYHGMLCGMAAFKQHCSFGFWKHNLIFGKSDAGGRDGMGQYGRITSVEDLPARTVLAGYVRKAMQINESGIRKSPSKAKPKPAAKVPDDLAAALKKSKKAQATFDAFSPTNKRDYIEWITEAKREETRAKRLVTAVEWMAQGKVRNWKYLNC